MISDKNIKTNEVDQGVIDQRPKRVEQPEIKNNSELQQKKRKLENKLDQALINDEPTADIHREIKSIERQVKEQQRLGKLQKIKNKKAKIKEIKERIADFRKEKEEASKKINDELLPELEEKKQKVREVDKKLNRARNDIHRFRMLIPEEEKRISNLNKELKELENNL
jgi:uncharacterized coiled-coil DUF342 family protein